MTKSAAARASGSTRRTAAAPSPNRSPRTWRGAVLVGVALSASPITAIFTPPRVIRVHGSAQSGRAVPVVSLVLAARKRYLAPAIRALSVATDQSNSWLPISAASRPHAFMAVLSCDLMPHLEGRLTILTL